MIEFNFVDIFIKLIIQYYYNIYIIYYNLYIIIYIILYNTPNGIILSSEILYCNFFFRKRMNFVKIILIQYITIYNFINYCNLEEKF